MISRTAVVRFLLPKQFTKVSSVLCHRRIKFNSESSTPLNLNIYITGYANQRWFSVQNNPVDVDYEYVKQAVTDQEALIVDVREPEEVMEHGKIPNSINIPLGSIPNVLNQMSGKEFQNVFQRPKPDEKTEIIFYCMVGKRSAKATQEAYNLGFKNAKNYLGSWNDWATKAR